MENFPHMYYYTVLTCEEKYFSSYVMDFSVKKKIEVFTKRSLQVRNNKENLGNEPFPQCDDDKWDLESDF